jgi:hypothetical protein
VAFAGADAEPGGLEGGDALDGDAHLAAQRVWPLPAAVTSAERSVSSSSFTATGTKPAGVKL